MEQTGHWDEGEGLTLEALRGQLSERFTEIDFEAARADVRPFIDDAEEIVLWGCEFFNGLLPRLITAK